MKHVIPKFLRFACMSGLLLGALNSVQGQSRQVRLGDNMGDQIATKDLEMSNKQILNSSGIAIGVAAITNSSVALQVDGSNKAILVPRITNLAAIATPENGMMVYNTADNKFYVRQGNAWAAFADASGGVVSMNGKIGAVTFEGDETTITVNNTGAAVVISAKSASAIWNANKLNGNNVAATVPVSGQVLGWNGTQWMPVDMTANTALVVTNPAQPAITSVGTLTGLTVTDPIAGSVTGNAGTATQLATPRNINGVPFDGTADIVVSGASAAGSLTGTTLNPSVVGSSLTSVGTLTNLTVTNPIAGSVTGNAGSATTAAKLTTPRTINGVAFDGTANISLPVDASGLTGTSLPANIVNSSLTSVGTLTGLTVTNPIAGSVTGNAATATALATPRNINGVPFNGTADINISAAADANQLTGTTLKSTVLNSSLTSVGTLTDLTVTNPIAGSITGNAATATSATSAATVTTAAQPNITSVGTLTGLTVTAPITGSVTGSAATVTSAAQPAITSVGTLTGLTVTNPIAGSVTGNAATATALATSRNINGVPFNGTADINITAAADANQLTGTTLKSTVLNSSLTSVGTLANLTVSNPIDGSITGNAASATTANSSQTAGTVTDAAQPAITSVGTLTGLTVTAPITGSVTGNSGTATKLATPRTINGVAFDGSANISISASSAANSLTGTTLATGVVSSSLTSVGTLANLTVTNPIAGSVTGNAATATSATTAGTVTTAAQPNITSVGTLTGLTVTNPIAGSVTGNAATATALATPRTINGVAFDGTANINITAAAGAADLTGTTLAANVVNSSLTSVGTLSNLTVTNPISGSITGNAATATSATSATSATTAGTVTTAAQPNITSVGTLTGLTVTNPIAGSVTGNAATATALATPRTINGVAFDGTANINITAAAGAADLTGTTVAANVVNSSLTSVGTLANLTVTNPISGSITGNAATATSATSATSATTAGTVTTAAQPNITSVGTLTGLTVTNPIAGSVTGNAATATALATPRTINGVAFDGTANINITAAAGAADLTGTTLAANVVNSSLTSVGTLANLTVTNPISGSITGNAATATSATSATSATTAGTVTTAAQPNITSVGTLTGLTVTNPIAGSVTGNAATATALATPRTINGVAFDGTANINITAAAGAADLTGTTLAANVVNSSLTSVGTLANLTVTNPISGSITGNAATATSATSATSATTAGTVTTAAQPNITSVGTLTGLTVTNPIAGSVTGNAATATALATPRTINSVAFDGTANINITAAAAAADLTGTTLAANVVNSSLTSVGTLANLTVTNPISGSITGNAATATSATSATSATTAGTVTTAAQPNITSVGTLTGLTVTNPIAGSVTGNAATATALATPRTINGVAFDGTANINITAAAGAADLTGTTLAANVVNSSLTSVGTLANLTVTNPIAGSITGNAATVTTNANLTGEVTSTGNATTVTNAAVIGKLLTGYSAGAGTVAATDNILEAIQKLDGNVAAKANLASPTFTGTPSLPTGTTGITQSAADNSTKLATTAYADAAAGASVAGKQDVLANSAGLATALSDETGTGLAVFATSPTLVTPNLGTPSTLVGTNITGTAAGLSIGGNAATVTTNANLTGEVTSTGNATTVTNAAVIGKLLTGYSAGAGTVAATDNILEAIQKLDGNVAAKANLASPTFTGTPSLPTGTTGITQSAADNSTKLATTAYADAAAGASVAGKQDLLTNSAGLATALSDETGTGLAVFATSPTLVTPNLGTPSTLVGTNITGTAAGLSIGGNAATVTTNANLTGEVTSTGNATTVTNAAIIGKLLTGYSAGAGTVAATDNILEAIQKVDGNVAAKANLASPTFTGTPSLPTGTTGITQSAADNSTKLATTAYADAAAGASVAGKQDVLANSAGLATALSDETGTGLAVFATSPTLVTPNLGTPSTLVGTNITGTAAGLSIGGNAATVTTNANLTGEVTSTGNATTVTNAAVIGKLLTGYSAGAGTVAATDNILEAIQKVDGNVAAKANLASPTFTGTPSLPTGTTGITQSAADNSTKLATTAYADAAAGASVAGKQDLLTNSAGLATALSDETGTGLAVFATSPTLVSPALGTPTALVGTNITGTAAGLSIGGNAATVTTNANLTGEVTSTGNATTVTNAAVIGKLLTGYSAGAGTVAATDNILEAIQKVDGNVAAKANLASPTFTGTPSLPTGTTGITQSAADNSTKLATTAYADAAAGASVAGKQDVLANSAGLATALSDETGTGLAVFATSPTLVTPNLGTPSTLVGTNITGTAAGLSIGGNAATVTTNANLTGEVTSTGNATTVTNAAVIGKLLTGYSAGAGTVAATDNILEAIQKVDGNVAAKANLASPTFTGTPTLPTGTIAVTQAASNNSTAVATTAYADAQATAAVTGKQNTLANSAGLATALDDETGTGLAVFATSPTLVTPALGTPSALVGTNITGTAAGLSIGGNAATATLASTVTTNANLTGEVTSSGNATTVTNAAVIGKVLTGYTAGAGTVAATDNILQAIQKVDGNTAAATAAVAGKQDVLTNSAGLSGALSDETGSGAAVFATSPTLVTPALGTPSALVGTNITGTAAGLSIGGNAATATSATTAGTVTTAAQPNITSVGTLTGLTVTNPIAGSITGNAATVTTNANLTGEVTSSGNATTVTNAAVIGKVLTGYTAGAGTVAATDNILQAIQKVDGNAAAATAAAAGKQDVITNSAGLRGALSDETGTGLAVFATSPVLTTPDLGTPSALVGTNITGTAAGLSIGGNAATATLASTVTTNANLTGEVTSVGNATTVTNAAVIGKVLTGYTAGAGTVAATDNILQAIQKVDGNAAAATAAAASKQDVLTNSAGLRGALSDETGTGLAVFATSPVLTTPDLGTPSALVGTNITGTAAGLSIGGNAATATLASTVTTNANLTGEVTSSGNATTVTNAAVIGKVLTGFTSGAGTVAATDNILQAIQKVDGNAAAATAAAAGKQDVLTNSAGLRGALSDETGTGLAVFATSPVLTTPDLGTPSALVGTNITGTAAGLSIGGNAATATLASTVTTNANLTGEVTSAGNATTVTNAAVIGKVLTGYTAGAGTVAATDNILQAIQKVDGNAAAATAAAAGKQDVLTNSAGLRGALSDETGTGLAVFATSPVLTTPDLGTPSALVGTNITGTAAGLSIGGNAATATSATTAGTVTTAAQPNITSVGTLTGLTVTNPIAGSITGNAATVTTNANLTGEVTSSGNATTVTNAAVIGKVLTGYTAGAGTVAATDNILQAIQKVDGNAAAATAAAAGKQDVLTNSAGLRGALSDETGTGLAVFATSPVLTTPDLGTPSALVGTNITGTAAGLSIGGNAATATLASTVTTNANLTGEVTSAGNATTVTNAAVIGKVLTGYTAGAGTVAATDNILQAIQKVDGNTAAATAAVAGKQDVLTNSAGLSGALSDETGSGAAVFATSPTLITPALGTPSALVGTNITGTAAGLSIGGNAATATLASTVTTNANLTGEVTSAGNATTVTNAAVIGKVLTGYTAGAGTVAATDNILQAIQKVDGNAAAATAAAAGKQDVLTNSAGLRGALSDETGTGLAVFATSPVLTTPDLGTPSALVGTNITGTAAGLSIGGNAATVTTNANLTGEVTSAGNATTVTNAAVIGKVLTGYTAGAGTVAATDNILQAIQKVDGNAAAATAAAAGKQDVLTNSAGLRGALSDETGTGLAVFATSPVLTTPDLGTPSALVGTNITGTASALSIGGNASTATLASTVTTNANLTGEVTSSGNSTTVTNAAVIGKVLTGYTAGAGTVAATDNILQAIQKVDGNAAAATAAAAGKQDVLTNSAGLRGALSDETGTGLAVFATSPVLTTPDLGTPSALVGTNITGTAAGLTAGTVTTNANLTGEVTSTGNATTVTNAAVIGKVLTGFTSGAGTVAATDNILQAIQKVDGNTVAATASIAGKQNTLTNSAGLAGALSDETGSGAAVFAISPTLVTPALGTPASGVATNLTGLPISTGVSGLGTGVATALAINTGTAGSVLVNGGGLGTPTSGTATNLTGLPISTGVSGLGTGVATLLGTPSSANLITAVTDETGSGALVFANSPTLVTPALGTPASGVMTNVTGLPLTTGVTGTLPVANGGTGLTTGNSGGILGYTAAGTIASSAALTSAALIVGGGAGATPASLALGSANQVLSVNSAGTAYTHRLIRTTLPPVWGQANLAASLTNTQLVFDHGPGVQAAAGSRVKMPNAGIITGVMVTGSAARSAGTATFTVFKNGAATTTTGVIDATNSQFLATTGGTDTFVAGDILDLRVTTTAAWAPTTAEWGGMIVVAFTD